MAGMISALIAGVIFGIGLILSGMANPAKVQGFLDITGIWDPSLALVIGGAIAVGVLVFAWVKRRQTAEEKTILGYPFQIPSLKAITPSLVVGSAAFGVGWGLVGFCPGPAWVGLGLGNPSAITFVLAMLAGMIIFELLQKLTVHR